MKPFNHISVLFSEPLEASLRFLMPEVLNARYRLRGQGPGLVNVLWAKRKTHMLMWVCVRVKAHTSHHNLVILVISSRRREGTCCWRT